MAAKRTHHKGIDAIDVAIGILLGHEFTGAQIGLKGVLDLGGPAVSRIKTKLEKQKRLKFIFEKDGIPEDIWKAGFEIARFAALALSPLRLSDREEHFVTDWNNDLGIEGGTSALREIHIFPSVEANGIGEYLRRHIPNQRHVGITWGRTLLKVVEKLRVGEQVSEECSTTFVPTVGDIFSSAEVAETFSSSLASSFQSFFKSTASSLSLAGIPPVLPRKFAPEVRGEIERWLASASENFRQIFVGPTPLIDELDCLLTSIGAVDSIWDMYGDLWSIAGISNKEKVFIQRNCVGAIGGVLIGKSDLPAASLEKIRELQKLWLGFQFEHFGKTAERAAENHPVSLGVVVFAFGLEKAAILFECLRKNIVNVIFCDAIVFDELEKFRGIHEARPH